MCREAEQILISLRCSIHHSSNALVATWPATCHYGAIAII